MRTLRHRQRNVRCFVTVLFILASAAVHAESPVTPDELTEVLRYSPGSYAWATANDFTMVPDGSQIYASAGTNGLALLDRDAETGELTFVEYTSVANTLLSSQLVFSNDGSFAYGRGYDETAGQHLLMVFSRSPNGHLSLLDTVNLGTLLPGWEIITLLESIRRSADGKSLYLLVRRTDLNDIEPDSNGILPFALNPATGEATAQPGYWANDGYSSISAVVAMDLSPDGLHLYAMESHVTDPAQRRLTIFERASDGSLTVKASGGITPLASLFTNVDRGARALEFVSDTTAYLTSQNGLHVVQRDPATGLLSERKAILVTNFGGENVEIHYHRYIAASPDGERVYTAVESSYDGNYGGRIAEYLRSNDGGSLILSSAGHFGASPVNFTGLAVSPDSRFVYATRTGPNPGMVVYARTPIERELSLANELVDDGGPSPYIDQPYSVLNVGNRDVYVGGNGDIALYQRDPVTRELSFVETLADKTELAGFSVHDLEADSAGAFVYAGLADDSVAVFARDTMTGALTAVASSKIGANYRFGLIVTSDRVFTIGPDAMLPPNSGNGQVSIFDRNPDGTLTLAAEIRSGDVLAGGTVPTIGERNTLALSADGKQLYTSSVFSSLVVFDISDGGFDLLESHGPSNDYSLPIATADGKHVYEFSKINTGVIRAFPRNPDGTLGTPFTALGREQNPEALWSRVHFQGGFGGAVGSADSLTLHALGFRENGATVALMTYSRDPTTGLLTQRRMHVDGFGGIEHMAIGSPLYSRPALGISPAGDVVVVGNSSDGVTAFRVPPPPPQMFVVTDTFAVGLGGLDLSDATNGFAKSPDDKNLYLTGERSLTVPGDAIATQPLLRFNIDPVTKIASYTETIRETGDKTGDVGEHSAIMVPSDGADLYLLVENNGGEPGYLDHFARNKATGGLTWQTAVDSLDDNPQNVGLQRAANAAISGDGKNVYVASFISERSVLVYARQMDGSLVFTQKITNADMNGSMDPNFLIPKFFRFSPDHRFVYVFDPQRLHTFARDTTSGALTYVESPSELAGFPGVGIFVDAVFSDDGRHFYVGADTGLLRFQRNPADGSLAYVSTTKQGAVSPKGLHIVNGGHRIMALVQVDQDPSAAFDIVQIVAFYNRDVETGAVSLDITNRLENARNGAPGFNAFASYLEVDASGHFGWLAGTAFDGTTNIVSFAIDTDKDGVFDAVDPDIDGDGLSNAYENSVGLNPYSAADATLDADSDGLSALQEAQYGTHPFKPDTDGDGVNDGDEVAAGTNPAFNPAALIPLLDLLQ